MPACSIPSQCVVQHLKHGSRAVTEGVALPTRPDDAIERHHDGEPFCLRPPTASREARHDFRRRLGAATRMDQPLVPRPLAGSLERQPEVFGLDEVRIVPDEPAHLPFAHEPAPFPGQGPGLEVIFRGGRVEEELGFLLHGCDEF